MFENMSEKYQGEVAALIEYFKERLPVCGKFSLTEDQYKRGVDSLTGRHSDLVRGAYIEWLAKRNYELSYNQTCSAFFEAARQLELLEVQATGEVSIA